MTAEDQALRGRGDESDADIDADLEEAEQADEPAYQGEDPWEKLGMMKAANGPTDVSEEANSLLFDLFVVDGPTETLSAEESQKSVPNNPEVLEVSPEAVFLLN